MRTIRTPRLCLGRRSRQQQHQPPSTRDVPDPIEQCASFARRRHMVPENDSRPRGQGARKGDRIATPLVGHQPQLWQRSFAPSHRTPIARRVTNDASENAPAARLRAVRDSIEKAATRSGRPAASITLIAVSKTHAADAIRPLLEAGHRVFGENRVQEAAAKWPELRAAFTGVELHLIGQLQSNKAAEAVALFDAIHSVDRPSLVTALGKAMAHQARFPDCFLQVDLADEPQKGGCAVADLPLLLTAARAAGIAVTGLMCVPPAGLEPAPWFALLAKLAADHGLGGLSMGMSGDYPTAVTLGATHVRVGSALFGERA
jgi:PLP dependent protein